MHKVIISKDIELKDLYTLMISGVSPRPIAFVGSKDRNGNDNLAPFSYFNAFGSNPPIIGFSPANSGKTGEQKDTLLNIQDTKEFTVSIVNHRMVEQMSLASCNYKREVDEFVKSGFSKKESNLISAHGVLESPFIMECKVYNIIELGGKPGSGNLILGEVICFHVDKNSLDDNGKISPIKLDPVARLGYNYYSRPKNSLFEVFKPRHNGIGFDCLPKKIRESECLNGGELAKLAGVKELPSKSGAYSKFDIASISELYKIIQNSLRLNNIDEAWQAAIRIIEKK